MKHHLIIAALLSFTAQSAFAQMPPSHPMMERVISVSGEAEEDIEPDQAILNVSLVSRNPSLETAKEANDALSKRVVAALRDFKIPENKIANSHFYINPEYRYENKKRTLTGYVVNRSLRITMDDISIHERVISKLVELKVEQIGGVQFTLKDREKHADAVRVKAFKNAKSRAMSIANAAGVKLGKPVNISVSGGYTPQPMPMMRGGMEMMAAKTDTAGGPSLPGLISLHERLNVVFEME